MRFFVTSLGNPRWVVDRVQARRRRRLPRRHRAALGAERARCRRRRPDRGQQPRRRARGAAQRPSSSSTKLPTSACRSCAPAASATTAEFVDRARASATPACSSARASSRRPSAARTTTTSRRSSRANERDIVLTERLTGVPVAVIETPYIERIGTHAGLDRSADAARPAHEASRCARPTRCARSGSSSAACHAVTSARTTGKPARVSRRSPRNCR